MARALPYRRDGAAALICRLRVYSVSVARILCIAVPAYMSAGCVTTTVENYERVPGSRAEQAYIKPGVNFRQYRRLYPLRLEIYYADGADAPTSEDLERIRAIFRTAFLQALGGDYVLASQPAADALAVRASLVDLQSKIPPDELQLGGKLSSLVANGQLTFFMELSDSLTGEVLARAADPDRSAGMDSGAVASAADSSEAAAWSRVEAAAARWAGMFRAFLDQNLGR